MNIDLNIASVALDVSRIFAQVRSCVISLGREIVASLLFHFGSINSCSSNVLADDENSQKS
jgi:hypothetical protein